MPEKQDFLTIRQNGSHELIIKKSKFITHLARTESVTAANAFIKEISSRYRDANHNTYAYTIGLRGQQVKASDNGEPSGTAGVPELKALQLMKLKNVTAVVTRYFGGIKLGAGGLIRAYSNSVTQAVEKIGVVKKVRQKELIFSLPYNRFDQVKHFLQQKGIALAHVSYTDKVTIHVFASEAHLSQIEKDLTNLLAGQISFQQGQERYQEIAVKQNNFHEQ